MKKLLVIMVFLMVSAGLICDYMDEYNWSDWQMLEIGVYGRIACQGPEYGNTGRYIWHAQVWNKRPNTISVSIGLNDTFVRPDDDWNSWKRETIHEDEKGTYCLYFLNAGPDDDVWIFHDKLKDLD